MLLMTALGALFFCRVPQIRAEEVPDRIHVLEVACVENSQVVFEDVTEATGPHSQALRERFADRMLAEFNSLGPDRIILVRHQLTERLEAFLGRHIQTCLIPDSLTVQRGGMVFGPSKLQGLVVDFLTKKTGRLDGEVGFREFRLPSAVFLPDASCRVDVSASKVEPGRVYLTLTAKDAYGRDIRRYAAGVFVDLWKAVPCAARPMNRGEALRPDAVEFETKNLAYAGVELWDGKGGPWRVVRPIGLGRPITADALEPLPDVAAGDNVQLTYEGRHVVLSVPAKALEDGYVGKSIPVLNLQSERRVVARVRSHDQVVVQ
jgi:flagella basal body P-ring formation protein FlgA